MKADRIQEEWGGCREQRGGGRKYLELKKMRKKEAKRSRRKLYSYRGKDDGRQQRGE